MDRTVATYKIGARVMQALPDALLRPAVNGVCRYIPRLSPGRRLMAERNLERSTGRRLDRDELDRGVSAVFTSYARYYTDTARLPALTPEVVDDGFSYEGFEHIENGVAAGRGTILVLPHVGGWEWAGSWLAKVPGYTVSAVVEPIENEELREWMADMREAVGMEIMPLSKGIGSELIARLKDNQIVCLMSDRNLGDGGIEVEFFGERTELPGGPATLGLRTGAAVVPVAVYHRGAQNHAIVEPPIDTERRGRLREDVTRATNEIAGVLERQIRREPEQWLLLQPNWPSDHQALEALSSP